VTYKRDISDQRESPATALAQRLLRLGATLTYHDPHVPAWSLGDVDVPRADDLQAAVIDADLVILVQNHSCYDAEALAASAKQFFDTRGATSSPHVHRL